METTGAGLVLSALLTIATSQLLRTLLGPTWQMLIFLGLCLGVWLATRVIAGDSAVEGPKFCLVALASLPSLVGVAAFARKHPLDFSGVTRFFVDTPHHQSLANGLAKFGPFESLFVSGEWTRYHWFVYSWFGALERWVGAEPFLLLTRIGPVLTLVTVSTLSASIAWKCSRSHLATLLAVLLGTTSLAFFRFGVGSHIPEFSQSQSASVAWMLLVILLILRAVETGQLALLPSVALFLLSAFAAGGKVSHGAVLIAGCASLALFGRRHAAQLAVTLKAVALVSSGVATTFLLFVVGGNGNGFELGLGISSSIPVIGIPVWALFRVLAWTGRLLPGLFAEAAPVASELWVLKSMAPGLLLSGLAGFFLTSQNDGSNMYFMSSASSVLAILAGVAAASIWRTMSSDHQRLVLLASFAVAASGVAWMAFGERILAFSTTDSPFDAEKISDALTAPIVWSVAIGGMMTLPWGRLAWPRRAQIVSLVLAFSSIGIGAWDDARQFVDPPNPNAPSPWTEEQDEAARWLRGVAADESGVVMTNRFCERTYDLPPDCGGVRRARWFWTAAIVGQPMYIEGYEFHYGYSNLPGEARERIARSMRFAAEPEQEDRRELWASGVRWLWLDLSQPSALNWDGFGQVRFENEAVRVVRLSAPDS